MADYCSCNDINKMNQPLKQNSLIIVTELAITKLCFNKTLNEIQSM